MATTEGAYCHLYQYVGIIMILLIEPPGQGYTQAPSVMKQSKAPLENPLQVAVVVAAYSIQHTAHLNNRTGDHQTAQDERSHSKCETYSVADWVSSDGVWTEQTQLQK